MPSQPLMNDNNDFFPGRAWKLREVREKREEKGRKKNKPPKPRHSCFANTHRTSRKPLARQFQRHLGRLSSGLKGIYPYLSNMTGFLTHRYVFFTC